MYQQNKLPRWRGFNLPDAVGLDSPGKFQEEDFQIVSELGFDFVRLPVCYRFWSENGPWKIDEAKMDFLDEAIAWAQKYRLHVELALHRAPGYCVAKNPPEPFDLFQDEEALEAFQLHWRTLAKRYRGIDSGRLSFNMVNEPANVTPENNERVMMHTVNAIHEVDPERLCIVDGLCFGNTPSRELADLGNMAQSCRGYLPKGITHYKAQWSRGWENYPDPQWPDAFNKEGNGLWDEERLFRHYQAWAAWAEIYGIGVHCGEGGCYNRTPHIVTLQWMESWLKALKAANIGYALWNLRGDFGILDSGRVDVEYENYRGHQLDRKMLELLQRY